MSNNIIMSEKRRALLAQKQSILQEIKYYENRIEEASTEGCKSNSFELENDDNSDSDVEFTLEVDNGPSIKQLKQQQSTLKTCLQATQELTNVEVLQSEVNVMVEDPLLDGEPPVKEPGVWREVVAECCVGSVPFTMTYYTHQPERKFGPVSYRGLKVTPVKRAHEAELSKSVLPGLTRPSDAVEVLRSYAEAHRSRRNTLARIADKYANSLFMEPLPEGGYLLKCANHMEISWTLRNKWSPIVPFLQHTKCEFEYMDEPFVKIIQQAHRQFCDPDIETDERTFLLSKMISTCLEAQAQGQDQESSSDQDTASKVNKRRTTIDEEPDVPTMKKVKKASVVTENKDSEIMAPPKSLPKKSKPKGKENIKDKPVKRTIADNHVGNAKKMKTNNDTEAMTMDGKSNKKLTDAIGNSKYVAKAKNNTGNGERKDIATSKDTIRTVERSSVASSKNEVKSGQKKKNTAATKDIVTTIEGTSEVSSKNEAKSGQKKKNTATSKDTVIPVNLTNEISSKNEAKSGQKRKNTATSKDTVKPLDETSEISSKTEAKSGQKKKNTAASKYTLKAIEVSSEISSKNEAKSGQKKKIPATSKDTVKTVEGSSEINSKNEAKSEQKKKSAASNKDSVKKSSIIRARNDAEKGEKKNSIDSTNGAPKTEHKNSVASSKGINKFAQRNNDTTSKSHVTKNLENNNVVSSKNNTVKNDGKNTKISHVEKAKPSVSKKNIEKAIHSAEKKIIGKHSAARDNIDNLKSNINVAASKNTNCKAQIGTTIEKYKNKDKEVVQKISATIDKVVANTDKVVKKIKKVASETDVNKDSDKGVNKQNQNVVRKTSSDPNLRANYIVKENFKQTKQFDKPKKLSNKIGDNVKNPNKIALQAINKPKATVSSAKIPTIGKIKKILNVDNTEKENDSQNKLKGSKIPQKKFPSEIIGKKFPVRISPRKLVSKSKMSPRMVLKAKLNAQKPVTSIPRLTTKAKPRIT